MSSFDQADLKSILESAISGNAAVFDASPTSSEGLVVSLPLGVPFLDMTRSTWSVSDANLMINKEHVPDSVPLLDNNLTALDSTSKGRDIKTKNNKLLGKTFVTNERNKSHIKPTMVKDTGKYQTELREETTGSIQKLSQKSHATKTGLYIPFEKLSRFRRQATVSTSEKRNDRQRVLLLLNPNIKKNISAVQEKLDGRVLMLVKKPNISKVQVKTSSSEPVISVQSRNNLHELLHTGPISLKQEDNLREIKQSLPAIQMINNLNKIDLPLTPNDATQNFSVKESNTNSSIQSLLRQNSNSLQKNNWKPNNNLNSIQKSVEHLKMKDVNGHPQSRIFTLNSNNRQTTDRQNTSLSSRQPSAKSNTKQLWISPPHRVLSQQEQNLGKQARLPTEPQLALQHPVSSNRIRTRAAGISHRSDTVKRLNRPLVRTVSSQNQRRQTRRRVAPGIIQRGASIRRRIPATRRHSIRRLQSPPDPFTVRFSAGFQRGSNLLHQPRLELTSFDSSSDTGFNTLTPAETRLPPFSPSPGMFGGLGLPGLFSGPIII